jgi:hypothetical protein
MRSAPKARVLRATRHAMRVAGLAFTRLLKKSRGSDWNEGAYMMAEGEGANAPAGFISESPTELVIGPS